MKVLFTLTFCVLLSGCGFPQYQVSPTPADNSVTFEKAGGDLRGGVRIGADTDAKFAGVKFTGANGTEFSADSIDYTSNKSNVLAASVGPMSEYEKQMLQLANIATANWTGFTNVISAAAPVAGAYLSGLNQVNLAKAQSPTLISQLANLAMNGQVNQASLQALGADPEIINKVNELVDARIKEYLATHPPTTQPVK